jgi:hypothetical protein
VKYTAAASDTAGGALADLDLAEAGVVDGDGAMTGGRAVDQQRVRVKGD